MAVLRSRARLHLVYRLAGRLLQALAVEGGARTGPWRLLLVGFAGLDIALWAVLRDPNRFLLKTRMVIDAIDIATWSLAPYPNGLAYDAAVVTGFPLAMEAGFRLQWLGLIVPAFGLGVTAIVRIAAGSPVLPFSFLWLVLAVAAGIALRRHDARLRRQVHREWEQHRSAEEAQAFLAGQNAVAMGTSSVVDELASVLPLVGGPASGSALFELADAWKARLSAATTRRAVYLGMAVHRWAAMHNQHPDLASQVLVTVAEGDGTSMLTGSQAAALDRLLGSLDLRGPVRISLADRQAAERPPGGVVRLAVNALEIVVPADAKRAPRICDPAPLAFVLGAIFMARGALAIGEDVPLVATAVCVAVAMAAARWSHVRLRRLGAAARPGILLAVIGIGTFQVTVGSLTMRHFLDAASGPLYPGFGSFLMLSLIGGMYYHAAERPNRSIAVAGAALLVGLSWFLHEGPQQWWQLLLTLVVPTSLYLTGMRVGSELEKAEELYAKDLRMGDAAATAEAFEQGRETVVQLAQRASDDAKSQLANRQPELDPAIYAFAGKKLEEVDRRLKTLTNVAGSCSSMTATSLEPASPAS